MITGDSSAGIGHPGPDGFLSHSFRLRTRPGVLGTVVIVVALTLTSVGVYALRFATAVQPGVSHDDAEYIVLAESFATGRPYRVISYPEAPLERTWPPGYPALVLTVPWLLFGPNVTALRGVNLLLAMVNGVMGYRLARRYLERPVALAAAAMFLLNPQVAGTASVAMSDTAFTFFCLAFLLVFLRWDALGPGKRRTPTRFALFLLAALLLAAAILTRYWGVAVLGGAVLYLATRRQFARALALAAGVGIALLPFLLFLAAQPQATADLSSYRVAQLAARSPADYARSAFLSLSTYGQAIPLVLVPLLGPGAASALGKFGVAWVVTAANTVILLVAGAGFATSVLKQRAVALVIACYGGMLLLFTAHIGEEPIVFDEPRYLVPMLLFLYVGLIVGLRAIVRRVIRSSRAEWIVYASLSALVVVLILRNVQQSRTTLPVADLSAGASWTQAHTDTEAVFMTPDPVSRYLYLRRHTVDYPTAGDAANLWSTIRAQHVDYLLTAPPLRLGPSPNNAQLPDPAMEEAVLPLIRERPECFTLVFEDRDKKAAVYQVERSCAGPLDVDGRREADRIQE